MQARACCLCSQIDGSPANDLVARLLPAVAYRRRVIMESDHFAVIPSLGSLSEGHILVCPKQHIRSISSVASEEEEQFLDVKDRVQMLLTWEYRQPIHWFEHGMVESESKISCTVEHAHLHALPLAVDIVARLEDFERIGYRATPSEVKACTRGGEYLYYESPFGESLLAHNDDGRFESQWFRKVFAEASGCPTLCDWRESPRPEIADYIFEKLIYLASASGYEMQPDDR